MFLFSAVLKFISAVFASAMAEKSQIEKGVCSLRENFLPCYSSTDLLTEVFQSKGLIARSRGLKDVIKQITIPLIIFGLLCLKFISFQLFTVARMPFLLQLHLDIGKNDIFFYENMLLL